MISKTWTIGALDRQITWFEFNQNTVCSFEEKSKKLIPFFNISKATGICFS